MPYHATDRTKWKARLCSLIDQAPEQITRPVRKLMAEVTFGILTSGSLTQAEIARTLNEPCRLHHTQKRISRMLAGHSEVAWAAEQVQLAHVSRHVTQDMILAIDPGDLNRDGAPKSEWRGRVRDGDTGEIVGGYPLMTVVARDVRRGKTLPLLTRLNTPQRTAFRSENHDILSVMDEVSRHIRKDLLWVIDRGGDRGILWDAWIRCERQVLVRAANQRYWCWRDRHKTAQQIARELPLKHQGQLRRGGPRVRFGITRVMLREHPDSPLWMIVVRHDRPEPLVLVTTRPVRGRRQGERMIHAYMDRWACEEGYRFTKQGFALESVPARRFTTLQNLVALASLAWGLLAVWQDRDSCLIRSSRRQKPDKALKFPFYSLLKGWQNLFRGARVLFWPLWRKRKPRSLSDDLFARNGSLATGPG